MGMSGRGKRATSTHRRIQASSVRRIDRKDSGSKNRSSRHGRSIAERARRPAPGVVELEIRVGGGQDEPGVVDALTGTFSSNRDSARWIHVENDGIVVDEGVHPSDGQRETGRAGPHGGRHAAKVQVGLRRDSRKKLVADVVDPAKGVGRQQGKLCPAVGIERTALARQIDGVCAVKIVAQGSSGSAMKRSAQR